MRTDTKVIVGAFLWLVLGVVIWRHTELFWALPVAFIPMGGVWLWSQAAVPAVGDDGGDT